MILSISPLAFIIPVVVVVTILAFRYRKPKPKIYPFKLADLSVEEQDFMNLWAVERAKKNLYIVKPDDLACEIAWYHNQNMIASGSAYHSDPNETFAELADRGATNLCEIVDSGFSTVESAFRAFVGSPEHHKILLSNINVCGISVETNIKGKYFITMIGFKI